MNLLLLNIFLIGTNQFDFVLTAMVGGSRGTVDCIVQAAQVVGRQKIAVEFSQESEDLASEILKKIKLPVVLNSVERRNQAGVEKRTSNDVSLLLKDFEAEKILNDTLWHGETRFLIITQDKKKIERYFERFWKLKVINVFGMALTEGSDFLYSFLPYKKQNCTEWELVVVDACSKGQLRAGGVALKDSMRLKTTNGCPFTFTVNDAKPSLLFEPDEGCKNTSRIRGFEGNLMAEIAKIYNIKPTFKLSDDGIGWGWIHPTPHGAIGDVYLGVSDMTLGQLAPLLERYYNLQVSRTYNYQECLTFAVPRGYGAKKPTWLTIFVLEFTPYTWILIIFSFASIAINMWLINRCLRINWVKSKTDLAMLLFSSFLGLPTKIPQYTSAKTSAFFWIAFSFVVTVAYKSSMGSKLAVPPPDVDIRTLEDLLSSDLKLTGLENMRQVMVNTDSQIHNMLDVRYYPINDTIERVVERLTNRDKIAYLRHKSTFNYYSLIDKRSRGRIFVMDDCVYTFSACVVLKKFSPFTNRINQIITRLEESGIMDMWRAEYDKQIPLPAKPFFKLSIDQMYGIFYFLCVGFSIALFSFLCELCFVAHKFPPRLSPLLSLCFVKRVTAYGRWWLKPKNIELGNTQYC